MVLSVFPLVVGGFIFVSVSGEAVTYYVTPTEPPNSDCPGEPCQTLDYYFSHGDRYFNSDTINTVTMILSHGKHTLRLNSDYYAIKDLETFEMVGTKLAADVAIYLSTTFDGVLLINVTTVYIETITFIKEGPSASLKLIDNMPLASPAQYAERKLKTRFITINGSHFNGVALFNKFDSVVNFDIVTVNSTFTHGSAFQFSSYLDIDTDRDHIRLWRMTGCTFRNSSFYLKYKYTNVTISDDIFINMLNDEYVTTGIDAFYSTIVIDGNVLFSNMSNGLVISPFLVPGSCNVIIMGDITFANNKQTPITAFSSNLTFSGSVSFLNNTGTKGGAINMYWSKLNIASNTTVYFYSNSAAQTGGAIFVKRNDNIKFILANLPCFYQLLDYNEENWYKVIFRNNSAKKGGDHIYGEYMQSNVCYAAAPGPVPQFGEDGVIYSYLVQNFFVYDPDLDSSLSSVSSDPTRVCLCDDRDQPQCVALDKIYVSNIKVHPGETFTISAVVVGANLGTTIGTVHTIFVNPRSIVELKPTSQYVQWINNNTCSTLSYTIFSRNMHEIVFLTTEEESLITVEQDFFGRGSEGHGLSQYQNGCVTPALLYTPLLLNITLLPCPLGFTLLGNPPGCDCYPVLTKNKFDCKFINRKGYHSWSDSWWLNVESDVANVTEYIIYLAQYCPFDYCNSSKKVVNLQNDTDAQCLFSHAGRLCGGCKENYSLAIGSSHCILCPQNNINLLLLTFFAAAGILLVFFISVFNLTVTQGKINGLILYANIILTYQSILFPKQVESNPALAFLRVFIAWLNLDFGIQVCFFKGLNAFWKTWLQYLFPFYTWSIAGAIIVGARFSAKLTNFIGNRAVSVLATLFLLSYTKLLRAIIASVAFTPLKVFTVDKNYTLTVWSLDGHYHYVRFPHLLLFITAVFIFVFLWLPYTFCLFLMQWLRKISHLTTLLHWIPRLKPVFDAYFAPLKNKHHYWFGVLLIVRGALLVIFTSTFTVNPNINLILLLMTAALLLCYANYCGVYKSRAVQLTENVFLLLLVLVGGSGILEDSAKHGVVYTSIALNSL